MNETREPQDWLQEKCQVVERPFASTVPLLGPLIDWIRTAWINVATRWYVRPLTAQQNEVNALLVQRVRDFENYVFDLGAEQDRELALGLHDLAALEQQLAQLKRRLDSLGAEPKEPQLPSNSADEEEAE